MKAAGIDPLLHYLANGRSEGRIAYSNGPTSMSSTDPLVSGSYVLNQVASIVPAGFDTTAWFHNTGWHYGVNPDAYFDTSSTSPKTPT